MRLKRLVSLILSMAIVICYVPTTVFGGVVSEHITLDQNGGVYDSTYTSTYGTIQYSLTGEIDTFLDLSEATYVPPDGDISSYYAIPQSAYVVVTSNEGMSITAIDNTTNESNTVVSAEAFTLASSIHISIGSDSSSSGMHLALENNSGIYDSTYKSDYGTIYYSLSGETDTYYELGTDEEGVYNSEGNYYGFSQSSIWIKVVFVDTEATAEIADTHESVTSDTPIEITGGGHLCFADDGSSSPGDPPASIHSITIYVATTGGLVDTTSFVDDSYGGHNEEVIIINETGYTSCQVQNDQQIRLNIEPDAGYKLSSITIDEQEVDDNTLTRIIGEHQYYFNSVQEDHEIIISFEVDESYVEPTDVNTRLGDLFDGDVLAGYVSLPENIFDQTARDSVKRIIFDEYWDVISTSDYGNCYGNRLQFQNKIHVPDDLSTGTNSELDVFGETVPYVICSIYAPDDTVIASVIVYIIQRNDFIIRQFDSANPEADPSYSIHQLDYSDDASGYHTLDTSIVYDYGPVNYREDGMPEYQFEILGITVEGYMNTTSDSCAFHVSSNTGDNTTLCIYKPSFAGCICGPTGEGSGSRAAAWDFGNVPFVNISNTSESNPAILQTFFGYSSLSFALPEVMGALGGSGLNISSIVSIRSLLPEGAVGIDGLTVEFLSDFYNIVPLAIDYIDGNGVATTGYLTIERVGLEVEMYGRVTEDGVLMNDFGINHGTQPGPTIEWTGDNDTAITATFYFPTTLAGSVSLYTLYEHEDGSTEVRIIENGMDWSGDGDLVRCQDFILFEGARADCPVRISIIAIKPGSLSTDSDTFNGACLGSGAGVEFTLYDGNE